MDKKAINTLEFDKIIKKLSEKATSDAGKAFAEKILPMTNPHRIRQCLQQSSDALGRILRKGELSFSGVFDAQSIKGRLRISAGLSMKELLSVAGMLFLAQRAAEYNEAFADDEKQDSLSEMFGEIFTSPSLCKEINRCILSEEDVADDASPELARIRRQKSKMDGRVHERLNRLLTSPSSADCLQDRIVVQRNGHYCIPVRAEYKSRFPGVVQDSSASGQTLFIEPMAVLELSNELRELEKQEDEEIERILLALSEKVGECIDPLINDYKLLTRLDFIFAKGKLALGLCAAAIVGVVVFLVFGNKDNE